MTNMQFTDETRHEKTGFLYAKTKASFMCAICTRGANLHPGCIVGHVNGVL